MRLHGCTETEVFRDGRGPMMALNRRLERWVARRVLNVFSTTRFYKTFFVEQILRGDLTAAFKNYPIVPNTVPPPPRRPAPRDGPEATFLCLGRFNEVGYNQKNFELVAQALALLKRRQPETYARVRLHVIGRGERRGDFEALIADLGIADRITLTDALPNAEVQALQARATACLQVSRYEGMSMYALEAIANGAPLVAARGTGVAELVRDGENGCLVDYDDPDTLAAALARLADADLAPLRAASRRLYDEEFHPDRIVERLLTAIDLCTASRK